MVRGDATTAGLLGALLLSMVACQPPPPAPEGLDEAARFMFREFYKDDTTIGVGLTALLDWYDVDGVLLEDAGATLDDDASGDLLPAEAFSLQDLEWQDLENIVIPDDGRDLANANGIVSIQDMACHWREVEALLARTDQYEVFRGDFDAYDRTYETSRSVWEGASEAVEFPIFEETLPDVWADDFVADDELSRGLMLTDNQVTSTELEVTLSFNLALDFRHGIYEVQGEPTPVWMILSVLLEPATGEGGTNTFEQSYSIEVNYARGDRTLRIFAAWTFVDSSLAGFGPDAPIWSTGGVNKSRAAAQRLSDICEGTIEIPDEP